MEKFDIDASEITNTFDINFETGEFITCVYKSEDENGSMLRLPDEIDLQNVMSNVEDTTPYMFVEKRYRYIQKRI